MPQIYKKILTFIHNRDEIKTHTKTSKQTNK